MGWTQNERTITTVNKTQQFRTVLFPTSALLPQVGGLNYRHRHFNGVRVVHFFAHDVFNFSENTQAGWQPGVQAGSQFADHPRTQHQLMADNFRVGWRLFQSREQILSSTHDVLIPLALQIAIGWLKAAKT